jgi:SPP1 gp7 family putative phage head morphogenesis protein
MKNPLLIDPTRTVSLRKQLMRALSVRFRKLRAEVQDFLVTKDALDLKDDGRFALHAREKEYQFSTDPQKLEAFNAWFAEQVAAGVFIVDPGTPADQPWLTQYVLSAFKRGLISAYLSSKVAGILGPDALTQAQFLRSSFLTPELMSKVRLLATRTFTDLKGVTDEMGTQLSRILAQGLIDGSAPLVIAKEMSQKIQGLTVQRAFTVARTEIIRSHAEGQLEGFRRLGIEDVGLMAEWSTAGDDRVCPECAAHQGKKYKLDEASGLIPLHPNCRCAWIPYVPDNKRK